MDFNKYTHTHTHNHLTALSPDYPGEPVPKRYNQSGFYWSKRQWVVSGISWDICKSAPRSRQRCQHPTTQFFTSWMPFLPPNQQHQSTEGMTSKNTFNKIKNKYVWRLCLVLGTASVLCFKVCICVSIVPIHVQMLIFHCSLVIVHTWLLHAFYNEWMSE